MSKVTSKLQVTIPKSIAEAHGIKPGDEIMFESTGETIRVRIREEDRNSGGNDVEWRLGLFDEATARQTARNGRVIRALGVRSRKRGWKREDVYERGVPR